MFPASSKQGEHERPGIPLPPKSLVFIRTAGQENITDWALNEFRTHYGDATITKWDIFHYVYAVFSVVNNTALIDRTFGPALLRIRARLYRMLKNSLQAMF